MFLTERQVRKYCRTILEYFSTGTKTVIWSSMDGDYDWSVREYNKNGFMFCEDYRDSSIRYFGQLVVDKKGVILVHGDWESKLENLYMDARNLLEEKSLDLHWKFYEHDREKPRDKESAWAIIRAEMEERRLQKIPDLYAKRDNGKWLSPEKVVEYSRRILDRFGETITERDVTYGGSEVVETLYERGALKISSKTEKDVWVYYEGMLVFKCVNVYDDIYEAFKDYSFGMPLVQDDYCLYVTTFEGGQWERIIEELAK